MDTKEREVVAGEVDGPPAVADELDVERIGGPRPEHELIRKVAGDDPAKPPPKDITEEEQADATAWLLSSFDGNEDPAVQHLLLNVGSREAPKKIRWAVKAIPREAIAKIRQQAEGNRQQRRAGANLGVLGDPEAAFRGNLRVVLAGTVEPDVRALAAQRSVPPEVFLEQSFENKGGYIDFLAGEILELSGYTDEGVEDAVVARAAGNSRG
jgi:hypothetical protein